MLHGLPMSSTLSFSDPLGILREIFVASQFAKAGDDEARLEELLEQERRYETYRQKQEDDFFEFFAKIGRFFK